MILDFFGSILQELGHAIHIPNLRPDEHNTCLIKFKEGINVQIEPDKSGQFLLIGVDLGTVIPGRYRENVFTEALKSNGLPSPRHGNFAYSKQTDHLILFELMPIKDLTGDKVADFLKLFLEKAKTWQEALTKNEVPIVTTFTTSRPISGMFGLRP